MVDLTLRLSPEINNKLNRISELSGIPKANMILYAVNEYLRLGNIPQGITTKYNTSVRTSLRLSDDINSTIISVSKQTGINKNSIINWIIDYYIHNIWNYYSK